MRNRFTNFNYLSLERQTVKCTQQNTEHSPHSALNSKHKQNNVVFFRFRCSLQPIASRLIFESIIIIERERESAREEKP